MSSDLRILHHYVQDQGNGVARDVQTVTGKPNANANIACIQNAGLLSTGKIYKTYSEEALDSASEFNLNQKNGQLATGVVQKIYYQKDVGANSAWVSQFSNAVNGRYISFNRGGKVTAVGIFDSQIGLDTQNDRRPKLMAAMNDMSIHNSQEKVLSFVCDLIDFEHDGILQQTIKTQGWTIIKSKAFEVEGFYGIKQRLANIFLVKSTDSLFRKTVWKPLHAKDGSLLIQRTRVWKIGNVLCALAVLAAIIIVVALRLKK